VKFFAYEMIKKQFAENDAEVKAWQRLIAGGLAGASSHISMFPLEVVKTRMAAAPTGTYKGMIDCISQTFHEERSLIPFYRGLTASLCSTIPHSAIDLAVYETLKKGKYNNCLLYQLL
jgi:solute carrier family 25 phosphate transporter 23/24/25/41